MEGMTPTHFPDPEAVELGVQRQYLAQVYALVWKSRYEYMHAA